MLEWLQRLAARVLARLCPARAANWPIADAGDNLLPTDQDVAAGLLTCAAALIRAGHSVRRRQRHDNLRKDVG